jgi:hypothetical protein
MLKDVDINYDQALKKLNLQNLSGRSQILSHRFAWKCTKRFRRGWGHFCAICKNQGKGRNRQHLKIVKMVNISERLPNLNLGNV